MAGWIDELAAGLHEDPLTNEETERLLAAARDVAHRVERRSTPLAAFLLGQALGRATSKGAIRADALSGALETLRGLLPESTGLA